MAHQNYNDLRAFYRVHADHLSVVVAADQVHLVCITCGFDITVDAVDAGLPVKHDEEAEA